MPPTGTGGVEGSGLDDYDQMIFNQFMDEDEGEIMARKMQEEMYGGTNNNQNPMMGQEDNSLRKADSEQFGQLIGGSDSDLGSPGMSHGQMHMPQYYGQPQMMR